MHGLLVQGAAQIATGHLIITSVMKAIFCQQKQTARPAAALISAETKAMLGTYGDDLASVCDRALLSRGPCEAPAPLPRLTVRRTTAWMCAQPPGTPFLRMSAYGNA